MELFTAIGEAKNEYYESYLPALKQKISEKASKQLAAKKKSDALQMERDRLARDGSATTVRSSENDIKQYETAQEIRDKIKEKEDYATFMNELHGKDSQAAKDAIARGNKHVMKKN